MGRRANQTDADGAATGDLFAHFGVDLSPAGAVEASPRPTPAAACPRCGWLCVASSYPPACPVCGHHRALRLPPRRR